MNKLAIMLLSLVVSFQVMAEEALLLIGASYVNGSVPFNDKLQAPLGGISVGFGSYLSLGQALTRSPLLPGFVINEAQAGATTFDRTACNPECTPGIGWQGYDKQFTKALARVQTRDPNSGQVVSTNARYVVIVMGNDCLHSDAFGIPQSQAQPCSVEQVNQYIDRLIAVGQRAINEGITPVYDLLPRYEDLDLPLAGQLFGLSWMIGEADYNQMRNIHLSRIAAELPQAIQVDMWKGFEHGGDGLHPTPETAKRAAMRVAFQIRLNDLLNQ